MQFSFSRKKATTRRKRSGVAKQVTQFMTPNLMMLACTCLEQTSGTFAYHGSSLTEITANLGHNLRNTVERAIILLLHERYPTEESYKSGYRHLPYKDRVAIRSAISSAVIGVVQSVNRVLATSDLSKAKRTIVGQCLLTKIIHDKAVRRAVGLGAKKANDFHAPYMLAAGSSTDLAAVLRHHTEQARQVKRARVR